MARLFGLYQNPCQITSSRKNRFPKITQFAQMTEHRIADVRGCRGKIRFIHRAVQQRARGHKDVLRLRARRQTHKQHRNRQVRRDSPHVLPPGSQAKAGRAQDASAGTLNRKTSVRSALPGPTECSRREFLRGAYPETTPLAVTNSICKIYALYARKSRSAATPALKPTNTRLLQKLRARN